MRIQTLTWTHYMIVVAALGCLLVVLITFDGWAIEGWYWERAVGNSLQIELSFETGEFGSGSGCQDFNWGIVAVGHGGEFERQGLRKGDVPFWVRWRYEDGTTGEPMIWYHGSNDARASFYRLLDGARGGVAEFAVVPCTLTGVKPDDAKRWVSISVPKD